MYYATYELGFVSSINRLVYDLIASKDSVTNPSKIPLDYKATTSEIDAKLSTDPRLNVIEWYFIIIGVNYYYSNFHLSSFQ